MQLVSFLEQPLLDVTLAQTMRAFFSLMELVWLAHNKSRQPAQRRAVGVPAKTPLYSGYPIFIVAPAIFLIKDINRTL